MACSFFYLFSWLFSWLILMSVGHSLFSSGMCDFSGGCSLLISVHLVLNGRCKFLWLPKIFSLLLLSDVSPNGGSWCVCVCPFGLFGVGL